MSVTGIEEYIAEQGRLRTERQLSPAMYVSQRAQDTAPPQDEVYTCRQRGIEAQKGCGDFAQLDGGHPS